MISGALGIAFRTILQCWGISSPRLSSTQILPHLLKIPVLVSSPLLQQNSEITSIKREKVYFGLWFGKFQAMVSSPYCFWDCGEVTHRGRTSW
jgi:hypothetical protein